MTEKTAGTLPEAKAGEQSAGPSAATEFERLYRANVDAVTAYFARRSADPQLVADLTADTFVAVITGFESFDPRRGTARAWLFGIAGHVYASHCAAYTQQQTKLQRLAGRRDLSPDQVEELLERIDAERAGPEVPGGHVSRQSGVVAQGGKATQGGQAVKDGGQVTKQGGEPAVPGPGKAPISVVKGKDGSISVDTLSVPAGDILVLAFTTTASGMSEGAAVLTTGPVPSCVSLPAPPAENGNVARTGGSTSDSGTARSNGWSAASEG